MKHDYSRISGANLPENLIPVAETLLRLLREASPNGKTYTGKFLASHLNIMYQMKMTDVQIRAMVNHLRREHKPIIQTPTGYRYSEDPEELRGAIEDLEHREAGIRAARRGLEEILKDIVHKQQGDMFDGKDTES